jgi:predicted alpha/beta-hydrolase family hydrolase
MASQSPLFLFAHGAGAPSASEWMRRWAERLGTLGAVASFDYPYMKAGRKSPDRPPVLLAAHREALEEARERLGRDRPVVFAGKSMGSRMGCHLAVELAQERKEEGKQEGKHAGVPAAIVCFGYPLRGGGGSLRDEVLRALSTPILFLQGSRDNLCPLDDLERVRGQMRAPNQLFVVDGGDHSLAVRKRATAGPGSQADWDAQLLAKVRDFLAGLGLATGKA